MNKVVRFFRGPLFPILMVQFIGSLGISLVIPFLIFLVIKLGGNGVVYGFLLATYSFFQLIGAPILGSWSDDYGRRKILLLSQGGTLLAWVIFAIALLLPMIALIPFSESFVLTLPLLLLFIARALDGLTGGNVSVANAYLSDISTDENRKANFGMMGMAASSGFVIGPALAGLLGSTSLEEMLPILGAIVISIIGMVAIYAGLPESRKKEEMEMPHKHLYFSDILNMPKIRLLIILYFIMFLGFNIFFSTFPVHASGPVAWDVQQLGVFFSFLSFSMIVVQGPVLSWLNRYFGDSSLFFTGNIILMFSFFFLSQLTSTLLFIGAALYALGNGLMWPSFQSILASEAGKTYQGAIQGYATSSGSAASIVGLLIGGLMYQYLGPKAFLFISSIFLIVVVIVGRMMWVSPNDSEKATPPLTSDNVHTKNS
ncbi:MAG: MFS transporter [Bacteroidota bacterium]